MNVARHLLDLLSASDVSEELTPQRQCVYSGFGKRGKSTMRLRLTASLLDLTTTPHDQLIVEVFSDEADATWESRV